MKQLGVKKAFVVAVIFLFISGGVITSTCTTVEKQSTTLISNGKTLYVGGSGPGNYTRIQDAIDNASDGDTVFVYNGTYYENLVVDKSINLVGEDKDWTIIDGSGGGDVVYISADWVNVNGFTIENSGYNDGISLGWSSSRNTIIGNTITSNNRDGIHLRDSSRNTIIGNTITSNEDGIELMSFSNFNSIINNNILSNAMDGIYLRDSSKNTIAGNAITSNNGDGIWLHPSSCNNIIYHNNFINNGENAYDWCSSIWDNGYPSGGNYWDDYTGNDSDGDGIGDTPYKIPGGNSEDKYPLMKLWSNEPPYIPLIDGPTIGKVEKEYWYTYNAVDPDGDDVKYFIDWGDGTYEEWIGPYASGMDVKVEHTWTKNGTYTIKAKAIDSYGEESDWATFEVAMPKNQGVWFHWWLDRFPLLQRLLGWFIW